LVEARAPGSATIRATFQGVSGATEVRVLRGAFPQAAEGSVTLFTGPGSSPDPEVVAVTNGGAGPLDGLSVSVQHADGQPGGWLTAQLSRPTAPAQLTLTARSSALAAGMYEAEVRVSSSSSAETTPIEVALSVAGFRVSETDGVTSVGEWGSADQVSVVLSAQPSSAVVLSVTSSDPGEVSVSPASVRFTSADWRTPRSVTVRGVDDGEDDGDQTVGVVVSVDVGQSHDAFEGLGDRTVAVVNADDDDPAVPGIVIDETGPDTRVSETGTYDSIMVALAARPTSNVVLSVSSGNDFEVVVTSGGLLTFTPSNWSGPRVVVVRGVDDSLDDGDRDVDVTVSVVDFLSADVYDGRSARVVVRSLDDDRGGGGGDDDDDGGDDDDDDDDDDLYQPGKMDAIRICWDCRILAQSAGPGSG
jgi:hypothetical protein